MCTKDQGGAVFVGARQSPHPPIMHSNHCHVLCSLSEGRSGASVWINDQVPSSLSWSNDEGNGAGSGPCGRSPDPESGTCSVSRAHLRVFKGLTHLSSTSPRCLKQDSVPRRCFTSALWGQTTSQRTLQGSAQCAEQ